MSVTEATKLSSKKRKAAAKSAANNTAITFRHLPWSYLRLVLIGADTKPVSLIDEITARTHLTSALTQFLGISGTAVSVDILEVVGNDVYIRIPRADCKAVVEAVSGWSGGNMAYAWKIRGRTEWLGALRYRGGQDLFDS